jgi:predicted nucleotidyltransferase
VVERQESLDSSCRNLNVQKDPGPEEMYKSQMIQINSNGTNYLCHTKISNLQDFTVGEKQISRLDIFVHNALTVEIL